jgi:hypothetical protein
LVSTLAAKELARRFGGDPSSADWRNFGRLAGFTNQKPERRLETGLPPFVRLRECTGHVYSAAAEFLEQVSSLAKTLPELNTSPQGRSHLGDRSIQPLADFHANACYGGDLHRADMAWALHAASRGLSQQQITQEILHGRDLSKKGGAVRQLAYAERTATKAVTSVQPFH